MSFYCFSSAHVCVVDKRTENEEILMRDPLLVSSVVSGTIIRCSLFWICFHQPFNRKPTTKEIFRLLFWSLKVHKRICSVFVVLVFRVLSGFSMSKRLHNNETPFNLRSKVHTTELLNHSLTEGFCKAKSAKFSQSEAINSRRHSRSAFCERLRQELIWISCFAIVYFYDSLTFFSSYASSTSVSLFYESKNLHKFLAILCCTKKKLWKRRENMMQKQNFNWMVKDKRGNFFWSNSFQLDAVVLFCIWVIFILNKCWVVYANLCYFIHDAKTT